MEIEEKLVELRLNAEVASAEIEPAGGGYRVRLHFRPDSGGGDRVLTGDDGEELIFGHVAEARAIARKCGLTQDQIREPRP